MRIDWWRRWGWWLDDHAETLEARIGWAVALLIPAGVAALTVWMVGEVL